MPGILPISNTRFSKAESNPCDQVSLHPFYKEPEMSKKPQRDNGRLTASTNPVQSSELGKKDAEKMLGDRPVLKVSCQFGGFSWPGGATCSLAVTFDRNDENKTSGLTIEQADDFLCDAQLDVTIKLDNEDSEPLIQSAIPTLNAVAQFHQVKFNRKNIGGTLIFSSEEVEIIDFEPFVKHKGFITLRRTGDAARKCKPDSADNPDSDEEPGLHAEE